jgi:energy-coupling factor transporter ATP-binding protein EcfA2
MVLSIPLSELPAVRYWAASYREWEVTKMLSPIIKLRGISFSYKHRSLPSVSQINLDIAQGDFVLLTGATGCGKSTLLKMLNGLIPHESGGLLTGKVVVGGCDTKKCSIAQLSQTVGMVFQSPDDQIFSTTVFDETAFILENMGMSSEEITSRVHETLRLVGMFDHREASVHALSGGQKQRLAVASVLAARPQVLALDEPISQLDPQGAAELLSVLEHINTKLGMTIVIVEHRLHEVMPLCRRVVIMDKGQLIWQGTREEAFCSPEVFDAHGLRLPQTIDICRCLGVVSQSAQVADSVAAIQHHYNVPACNDETTIPLAVNSVKDQTPVIEVEHLVFQYERMSKTVLQDIHLSIPPGQFVALMGNNGAGKSTLLHQIGGLLKPMEGHVKVLGKIVGGIMPEVGMVLQNPDFMLFNNTVADEIAFALRQKKGKDIWSGHCHRLVEDLGLEGMESDFPLALSRGQRLRVAIAAVLACQPSVLLLDEPTTGQDIGHIEDIVVLLKEYTNQGGTVVFCTHDTEVAARFAERIIIMCDGKIIADGSGTAVFMQNSVLQAAGLKPPAALLIAQELYKGRAVTVKEVVDYVRQECVGSDTGNYTAS